MPFFNDRMSHGNLIVIFDVEFPKKGSITASKAEELKKVLPGPKVELKKKEQVDYLEDFHEQEANTDPKGGRGRSGRGGESDDEDGGPRGQRVECNNQ